mmetsp:Transcript_10307/g.24794  ORF Transcript_10307/g.24794 Transcript_10307/m.24794 type:complete len:213 (+) Transcript_10307:2461-3099(+)
MEARRNAGHRSKGQHPSELVHQALPASDTRQPHVGLETAVVRKQGDHFSVNFSRKPGQAIVFRVLVSAIKRPFGDTTRFLFRSPQHGIVVFDATRRWIIHLRCSVGGVQVLPYRRAERRQHVVPLWWKLQLLHASLRSLQLTLPLRDLSLQLFLQAADVSVDVVKLKFIELLPDKIDAWNDDIREHLAVLEALLQLLRPHLGVLNHCPSDRL